MTHDDHAPATGHGHGAGTDFADLAELLNLDALVFHDYLAAVTALVHDRTAGTPVRRIADLGCGTGTGTLALAGRFPDAELLAVDVSRPLLHHVARAAEARGLGARVATLAADLDDGRPPQLHDLDLVWASASVHHLADPERGLADIRAALRPGGWLALVEADDLLRFQPTFLPDPSLLEALGARTQADEASAAMPFLGADWTAVLLRAGFTIEEDRAFEIVLHPPLPEATARYALVNLRRLAERLVDLGADAGLTAADREALDALTGDGPGSVVHRTDLVPRVRRRLWLARSA